MHRNALRQCFIPVSVRVRESYAWLKKFMDENITAIKLANDIPRMFFPSN